VQRKNNYGGKKMGLDLEGMMERKAMLIQTTDIKTLSPHFT